jgi:predicted amidohydrolase YtcJ
VSEALRPADTILLGRTFTADPQRPMAHGVAMRDGIITAVGSADELADHTGPATDVVKCGGLIVPAFHDAHIHLLEGSLFDCGVNLHDVEPAQYLDVIGAAAAQLPPGAWVRGGGWSMAAFPAGSPDRRWLDDVVGGRPAYLTARDGHTAWVSTRTLELAGIDSGTTDPTGGRIERDGDGEPSGALHETAMKLVASQLPVITDAEWAQALELGQRYLHSLGIVGWQDARLSPEMLGAYLDAESSGRLSAYVAAAMHWNPAQGTDQIDGLLHSRRLATGSLVSAGMVKLFVDGVVENETAALHQPYVATDSHGAPLFDDAELHAAIGSCVDEGFNVHVHAVGDAGTTRALDAFEAVRRQSARSGLRHQICHLQVVADADVPRFAALDVIANVQALWACRDEQNVSLCAPRLGPDRFEQQYRFGDLARSGARLAFGSDWRVSTPQPLAQIEVAITRQPPGDGVTAKLGAGQELSLTTGLLGFTREAAYAAGLEERTGTLSTGRNADVVVLTADPFTVAPHDLASVEADMTVFQGRVVFTR